MQRRIMVVEDEDFQRRALHLALHRQFSGQGIEVQEFADPLRALECASSSEFAVVIADYRMPQMNGIDFLREIRDLQPEAIRLMLTASEDFETAVTAVNMAEVFRFIRKPWNQDFRHAVAQGLTRNAQLMAERAAARLAVVANETTQQRA